MPDKKTPGAGVAKPAATAPAADSSTELAAFLEYMEARAAEKVDMGERVLAATDLAGIFDAAGGDTKKPDDYYGVPLLLKSVDYLPSDFSENESAYGTFMVLSMATTTGEVVTVTTGAATIMQQVYKLITGGHLPCAVIFDKTSKPTAAGYYPKFLRDGSEAWEKGF